MSSKKSPQRMLSIAKSITCILTVVSIIVVAGCTSRQTFIRETINDADRQAIESKYPAELQQNFIDLIEEGERNAVLNYMRLGKKAYSIGYTDIAQDSFLKATAGIEKVYGYDQKSADVRSLWIEEGAKDFKGEPYERVMAFFYQGLVFIEEGDYENARASFKAGQLQDAFAEEEQNRCDFALLMYLEGWCSLALNDPELAKQSFSEVLVLRPKTKIPKQSDNLLVLVETGTSPRKVADGPGHSELKFRRGRNFKERYVELSVNGGNFSKAVPIEDIYYQAATRGGREVDKIVQGKAKFRSNAIQMGSTLSDIGSTTVVVAPLFDSAGNAALVGGAIGLVGVTSMAMGQSSRPHADTRYWNTLPDIYHLMSVSARPGSCSITVRYLDKDMNKIKEITKQIIIPPLAEGPKMVWLPS